MKSLRFLAAAAALSVVSMVSTPLAFAQDSENRERGRDSGGRDGGGRGGFGGGPGGFGGGPGGFPGGPGGMMGGRGPDNMMFDLLRMEEVRVEIELMPEQEESLRKVGERARGERPDFSGMRDASEEERTAMFEKMRTDMAKRAAEAKDQLEEILLPAQFERLEQIAVQARGAMGLLNPETSKSLAITPEQTEKMTAEMKTFGESAREQITAAFSGGDRDSVREKMQAMKKELDGKLIALLTDQQKADFEKLKGAAFALPEMGPMGGRGPGGDRGFGGDRGPGGDRGRGPGGDRGRPAAEE